MQKIIYINSDNRDGGGTSESFTITKAVNVFNQIPKKVKLLNAQIPYTWNNITPNNNRLDVLIFPGPVPHTLLIPVGRYDATTLLAALNTALNTVGVFTVTYSTTTLKYTFTSPALFRLDFTFANTIAEQIGFVAGTIVPGAGTLTLTSTNVVNLLIDYNVAIISNLAYGADNGVIPWLQTNPNLGILCLVPATVCFGSVINYSPVGFPSIDCIQSEISRVNTNGTAQTTSIRLTFTLALLSGLPIDLGGLAWSCQLMLEF